MIELFRSVFSFFPRKMDEIKNQKTLDRYLQKPDPWTCLHIDVLNDRRCLNENTGDKCDACGHLKYVTDLLASEFDWKPRGIHPETFRQ